MFELSIRAVKTKLSVLMTLLLCSASVAFGGQVTVRPGDTLSISFKFNDSNSEFTQEPDTLAVVMSDARFNWGQPDQVDFQGRLRASLYDGSRQLSAYTYQSFYNKGLYANFYGDLEAAQSGSGGPIVNFSSIKNKTIRGRVDIKILEGDSIVYDPTDGPRTLVRLAREGLYAGDADITSISLNGKKIFIPPTYFNPTTYSPPTFTPTIGSTSGAPVFNPALPLIVITHGWQLTGSPPENDEPIDWVNAMIDTIGGRANVIDWSWDEAYTKSLREATSSTANQGRQLARQLKNWDAVYSGYLLDDVQFIGHSLGTLVNAYASKELTNSGKRVEQFTILDRPFGNSKGSSWLFDSIDPESGSDTYTAAGNIDQEIFRNLLPKGKVKFVDNYYGEKLTATGATFESPVIAFNKSIPEAGHSEVHEWYQCTIDQSNTANPCTLNFEDLSEGFDVSLASSGGSTFRQNNTWDPGLIGLSVSPDLLSDSSELTWLQYNCTANSDEGYRCVEGSPAYLWVDEFTVPDDADFLSFDFSWEAIGEGDWIYVMFGDELLFSFLAEAAEEGELIHSGLIPISDLSGISSRLIFGLRSSGASDSAFIVSNLTLSSLPDALIVDIDVKPGDEDNCVNIQGHGVIPVAVLGDTNFDVSDIDIKTLNLGGVRVRTKGNGRSQCSVEHINNDDYLDLICQFDNDPTILVTDDGTVTLIGQLEDGTSINGSDMLCIVP